MEVHENLGGTHFPSSYRRLGPSAKMLMIGCIPWHCFFMENAASFVEFGGYNPALFTQLRIQKGGGCQTIHRRNRKESTSSPMLHGTWSSIVSSSAL
jgi:hypothetical protein